jgi:hypothetical protein
MSLGSLSDLTSPALKPSSLHSSFHSSLLACYVLLILPYFCIDTLFGPPSGTTIVMVVYKNKDILMVAYKNLPDEDKDIINKAMVQFQNKCLMSYTKSHDKQDYLEISTTESFDAWAIRYR